MDNFLAWTFMILGIVGLFGAILGLIFVFGKLDCKMTYGDSNYPIKYSLWGGCKVQTPADGWVPVKNWRVV